ncbi:HNH endonuclease signature motif containing protein [Occultella gossypii]|uniref:DUF222 domain-containing protein n=1 Tax=Occultella gossypii TaxID=2800820 RepID=A0ABS7S3W5_9MICO|nr:HNH endonuclease signature motif containing protein [Occultella gossypii]MBZ2195031.1 DUF222 domain-containing protein [Occultella gossypii]
MDDTTTTTGGPGTPGSSGGGAGTGGGPSGADVALASRMHLSLAELMAGSLDDQLIAIEAITQSIATADPVAESDRYGSRFLGHAALRTHLITQALTGAQLDWMGAEAEAGTWDTSKGFRTYPHYVAKTYGISGANARRMSTLATGLRNSLPATRTWLRTGQIGLDQAQILLKATTTQAAVDGLQYPATPTDPGARDTGTTATDATDGTAGSDGTDLTAASGDAGNTEGPGAGEGGAGSADGTVPVDESATDTADASDGTDPTDTSSDAVGGTDTTGAAGAGGGRVQTVEEFLLSNAATRSPEDLRRLVDHFVAIADPDATDKAHRAAADREFLNIDRTMDGYHVAGFMTIEHGQYVRTALEAIMGKPAAGETRTSGQRRAQALSDLAHMMLDQGKVGTSGSVRPHLGVLISYPEFLDAINTTDTTDTANAAEAAEAAEEAVVDEVPGGADVTSPTAPPRPITDPLPGLDTTDPTDPSPRSDAGPAGPAATGKAATPAPANEPGSPTQAPTTPTGPNTADATGPTSDTSTPAEVPTLPRPGAPVDLAGEPDASAQAPSSTSDRTGVPDCQSPPVGPLGQPTTGTGTDSTAVPRTDSTALPGATGTAAPGVNGTALPGTGRDWAALLAAGPATFIDNTGPVPRDLLDRIIGCAGEIYRIIFGPDNEILNHGRAHRLFTAAQRRAHVARDRHCVHPDCTVPPERCESHHSTHWANGGNTDLHDGALLCYYHHDWIHTHNITMTRRHGKWHFYKPDGTEILPTRNPWN